MQFNFPYFLYETKYEDGAFRVQLGGGYTFSSAPEAPEHRIFILEYSGMQYFVDGDGDIDTSITPLRNMAAMEEFYAAHGTWRTFEFYHPVYGSLNCKFSKPLEVPQGIKDGNGMVKPFKVELIEEIL